jgi:FkbM family methyltransferase
MIQLSRNFALFYFRIKLLFKNPIKVFIHVLNGDGDYSRITIKELSKYIINPTVIVEAGASDGIDTLNFVKNFQNATIYAVEPVKEQFDALVTKFKSFNNVKLFQVALSNKSEISNIFVGKTYGPLGGMGSSSILKPSLHLQYWPEISFNKTQLSKTVTLDKFIVDTKIKIIDLLWLDIQGMELEVMKSSIKSMQKQVKFLHLEISRIKFYDGMPSEKVLRKFLNSIGFKCVIDRVGAVAGNALYVNQYI